MTEELYSYTRTIIFLSEEEKVWNKMHGPAIKQNGRRTRFCIGNLFLCTQNISNLIVFPSYQIGLEIVQAVDVARVVGLETFSPRLTHDWPRILNGSLTDFLSVIGSLHVVSSHSYLVNPGVESAAIRLRLKACSSRIKNFIPFDQSQRHSKMNFHSKRYEFETILIIPIFQNSKLDGERKRNYRCEISCK